MTRKNIFVKFVILCVLSKVCYERQTPNQSITPSYHTADWKPNQSIFKPSYQNHTKINRT